LAAAPRATRLGLALEGAEVAARHAVAVAVRDKRVAVEVEGLESRRVTLVEQGACGQMQVLARRSDEARVADIRDVGLADLALSPDVALYVGS
jgi:hypothetical protein